MRSVELFAGAGGLAIAMSNASFRHAAVIERNHDACETFRDVTYLRDASVPAYADSCTNALPALTSCNNKELYWYISTTV